MGLRKAELALALVALALCVPSTAQVFTPPSQNPVAKPSPKPVVRPVVRPPVKKPATPPKKANMPPPPPPFVGIVPRAMTGAWSVDFVSGLLNSPFRAEIAIAGGQVGEEIGTIDYLLMAGQPPSLACSSRLVLERFENDTLIMTERMGPKGLFCPGGRTVTVQSRTGSIWFSWTKVQNNRPPKETMSGWGTPRAMPSRK